MIKPLTPFLPSHYQFFIDESYDRTIKEGGIKDMATIVNNPPAASDSGNGMGFLMGIIVLIIAVVLIVYYGVPYVGSAMNGPQVNVPGKIDVNVQNSK